MACYRQTQAEPIRRQDPRAQGAGEAYRVLKAVYNSALVFGHAAGPSDFAVGPVGGSTSAAHTRTAAQQACFLQCRLCCSVGCAGQDSRDPQAIVLAARWQLTLPKNKTRPASRSGPNSVCLVQCVMEQRRVRHG